MKITCVVTLGLLTQQQEKGFQAGRAVNEAALQLFLYN